MGKFDGIYMLSDMDGTLLDTNTHDISEENISAIKYFMSEGGRFGFATGRLVSELRRFDDLIGTNAPSVACNGSKVYDFRTGEKVFVDELGEDIIPFLRMVEEKYPNVMIEMTSDDTLYYYRPNSSLEHHKSISDITFTVTPHYTEIPHPWVKLAVWDEPEAIKEFARSVDMTLFPGDYNFMYSYKYCCEISTRRADKGNALFEARKMLPDVRTVVAIGDNENDILMLKNADISFVPSNAVPSAKAEADVVLQCDCNHSAVAEAIRLLEERL